jgi:Yip1-like protein
VSAHAEAERRDETRAWWLRMLVVAQAPRAVFAALRDDSREAAEDRQDPVAATAFLVGVALTLFSSAASSFADDPARAGIVIPVWLFVAGVLVAIVNFWVGGGVLYLAIELLGGRASYRQARHLLTLAAVPLALALVLLPVRIALYGDDIFRSGGADSGAGADVFIVLEAGFVAWALVLLAIGVRSVNAWGWPRAVAAVGVFAALLAFADLALSVFG